LWNNALINAVSLLTFTDGSRWGRLVENAAGAHLLNYLRDPMWSVSYWRHADDEVDFIVSHGADIWAVEIKSGRSNKISGLLKFRQRYPKAKALLVGDTGIPLTEFFSRPPPQWFI
jgi:predicted AAA+ superfamily ATPase